MTGPKKIANFGKNGVVPVKNKDGRSFRYTKNKIEIEPRTLYIRQVPGEGR